MRGSISKTVISVLFYLVTDNVSESLNCSVLPPLLDTIYINLSVEDNCFDKESVRKIGNMKNIIF